MKYYFEKIYVQKDEMTNTNVESAGECGNILKLFYLGDRIEEFFGACSPQLF